MRKMFAALLAICLLMPCTAALGQTAFDRDEAHAVVEMLFAAAAGTVQDAEAKLQKKMTPEDRLLRLQELSAYRRQVLPWLLEALRVEERPEPSPLADEPAEGAEEIITLEDSYAALGQNEHGAAYLQSLVTYGGTDADSCMEVTRAICRQWMDEIDAEMLREQNGDYVCWMYLPDSPIDYPVVQGTNNEYYISHMFNGRRNASGTLFVDWRNLKGFRDPNTIVYGHHMRNRSMFGCLDEYERHGFYESHPYMLFILDDKTVILEVIAAYTTDSKDHSYELAVSGKGVLEKFVELAKQKSAFPTDVQVKPTDRVVTLSTCAYAFENARFVVIGRLLSCMETIPVVSEN